MVYSLDFDAHRAVMGSGNERMRRVISGRFRQDLQHLNDSFGWSNERGADNSFEAVRHLVMGDDKRLPGVMYGYAYKYIVEFQGRSLPNDHFYPCSSSYQEDELQPQLDALGVDLNLLDLNFGGPVVSFPLPDDFPGIGHWTLEAVREARPLMDAAEGLSPAMQQVRGWLRRADELGHGIVGFYH